MNIKGNQLYQDTHASIIGATVGLLQKKELRKITVADICRRIGINRSTFYEHFTDIYDVINKTEKEYAAEISNLITKNLSNDMREASVLVLEFIKEHRDFYGCFARLGRQLHIPEELLGDELINRRQQTVSSLWEDDPVMAGYQWEYMKGSFNAIVQEWLRRDCRESTEQIINLMKRLSGTWSLK